jgi:Rps23 Pro-64 3,4-dihydroxylase Tpa1-like proline 4-hydroxylase
MWRPFEDEVELARRWRDAEPFPHLVVDDFVDPSALPRLLETLDEEPIERHDGDIFAFEASTPEPRTDALRALRASFGETFAAPLGRITGKPVRRADMRLYAYREGHFLLPHADHQAGVGRALAYAFYLPSPDPPAGGELELFRCTVEGGEIVATESARVIEARPNRIALFDVSDVSLHQVREVLSGVRISLAGWFYP